MTESQTKERENVISIVQQISNNRLLEMFAKLWRIAEWQHANIMRDPMTFLKRAAEEGIKSERLKYEIMDIICPAPKFSATFRDDAPEWTDERIEMRDKLSKIFKLVSQ